MPSIGVWIVTAALIAALPSTAGAREPAACVNGMDRENFSYWPPGARPRGSDPRIGAAKPATDEERRALHPVLWPNDLSARDSLRTWLIEARFECLEEAFGDLDRAGVRFASGVPKVVSFLGAMADFLDAKGGLTAHELDDFMSAWKQAQPQSLLPDLLWPRLLSAAAWHARGYGPYAETTPDMRALFARFNAEAWKHVQDSPQAVRAHRLWFHTSLLALADNPDRRSELEATALEAVRRFPDDLQMPVIAALRLTPGWGATPERFEAFAQQVRQIQQDTVGARGYAFVYTRSLPMQQVVQHPAVDLRTLRKGLLEAANEDSPDDIARLQAFACQTRDAAALLTAQARWKAYAAKPQVYGPTQPPVACRTWLETLPKS
jgi:hypothetical protein